jgi:hypothetical protein
VLSSLLALPNSPSASKPASESGSSIAKDTNFCTSMIRLNNGDYSPRRPASQQDFQHNAVGNPGVLAGSTAYGWRNSVSPIPKIDTQIHPASDDERPSSRSTSFSEGELSYIIPKSIFIYKPSEK